MQAIGQMMGEWMRIASEAFTGLPLTNVENNAESLLDQEVVVQQSKNMKVVVSKYPLASGSLQIQPLSAEMTHFSQWKAKHYREANKLIQKVIQIWNVKGITNYLLYAREADPSKTAFNLEVVPYSTNGWRLLQQFNVWRKIHFGGSAISVIERRRIAQEFKDNESVLNAQINQIETIQQIVKGTDVFCNQQVIDRQRIYEGKYVSVLYDLAPLVKRHFLIITNRHISKFSDLNPKESKEIFQISHKVHEFSKQKFPITTFLNKTGLVAGQTVPHLHIHLFIATKWEEFWGQIKSLGNIAGIKLVLPQQEWKNNVQLFKENFTLILNKKDH